MKQCKDHLGNEYSSIKEMCEHYGISAQNYKTRIKAGWSLEKTLTTKVRYCEDHLGNKYSSIREMCEHYGISPKTYQKRIVKGLSIKDALTKSLDKGSRSFKECKDHLGNTFSSYKKMSDHYGVAYHTLMKRLERNWTMEEALTKKVR